MNALKRAWVALRAAARAVAAFFRSSTTPYGVTRVGRNWYVTWNDDGTLVSGERSYPTQEQAEERAQARQVEDEFR